MSKSSKISFSVTLAGECTINEKHCTFYAIHRACTWFYCPKQHNDALNVQKITNIRAKSQTYGRSTGDFPKTTWVHWISVKLSCSRMFQITVQWFKNLNFVAVLSIFNFQPFKVLWVDFVILQCCLCLKSHSFDWLQRWIFLLSWSLETPSDFFSSCRNIQFRVFCAEIFILWCIVKKYWTGIVTCYMKMRQINELHADLASSLFNCARKNAFCGGSC